MGSFSVVGGYNKLVDAAAFVAELPGESVRESVLNTAKYAAGELKVDGFKTLVVKPLAAMGSMLSYMRAGNRFPTLDQVATEAVAMKALVSGYEIFTKVPDVAEAFTKVDGQQKAATRQYTALDGKLMDGPEVTPETVVAKRVFTLANWFIAVADFNVLMMKYFGRSTIVANINSWIYTVAGGYMGVQSFVYDSQFIHFAWSNSSKGEKAYQAISLLMDAAYIAQSIIGGLGIYYKGAEPAWLGKCRVVSSVGAGMLPAAQKITGYWFGINKPKTA